MHAGSPFSASALFSALIGDGDLPDSPEEIGALMDKFNSLPFDERGRILRDAGMHLSPWDQLTDGVDMSPAPPVTAQAQREAEQTEAARSFAVIRDFFGAGRKLTAKGNPTVADARVLAERLSDPAWERREDFGGDIRGADDLPHTQFLLRWARAAGAVRVQHGRMSATDSWARLTPMAAAIRAADTLLRKGPLALAAGERRWSAPALNSVVDEGVPHLLAILWAVVEPVEFELLLEGVSEVCDSSLTWDPRAADWRHDRYRWVFDELVDLLGSAGLAERAGVETTVRPYGSADRRGGTVALTELGRAILADYLTANGYPVPQAGEMASRPMEELFARIADWHPQRTEMEFDHWAQRHGPAETATALAACLAGGYRDPQWPVAAVRLADRLPEPFAEQAVRGMLDTPARGHAIMWLAEHGDADVEPEPEAMLRAGVDMLAVAFASDPDAFLDLIERLDDLPEFIADCATVPGPAAEQVLRAIGALHPDQTIATAARRAAMAHIPAGGAGRPRNHRAVRRRRRR